MEFVPRSAFWDTPLPYIVTPKSGPMRSMSTLVDVSRALTTDLPRGSLKEPCWRDLATLVLLASQSGLRRDIEAVTSELIFALTKAGWMERPHRGSRGHEDAAE